MRGRYDLGVLLVHGIGGQRRGDTLVDVAEPLIQSMIDWLGADAVDLTDTQLAEASAGEPAHVRMTIRRGQEVRRVLIAESWWADTFHPPGWWALARWLVWAVPFVIFRAADHGLSVIDTNEKLDDARSSHRWSDWVRVPWYVAFRLLKNLVSTLLVAAAVAFLVLGAVVAIVPRVRAAILSAQRVVIRYVGDSYCLVTKPIQAEATVSQVERDLRWLERMTPMGKVAIVAHSQGAELVHRVVARRTSFRPIASLITFGAGIAKLRAVGRLHARKWKALWAYLLRAIAAAITVGVPLLALRAELSSVLTIVLVVAAVIGAAMLVSLARKMLRTIVQANGIADDLRAMTGPRKLDRWMDLYATSDPVPEGGLPLDKLELKAAKSTRIANYRSPLRDHTAYPENGEAFGPAVLAELAGLVGWKLSPAAMVVVHNASERRERKTLVLVSDRLFLGGLVVAAVVLRAFGWARDVTDDVARELVEGAGLIAGWVDFSAATWIEAPARRDAVAGALLVLIASALYAVGAWLWKLAAKHRARRLFHSSRPPGAEPLGETMGFLRRFAFERIARHAERIDRAHGWPAHPKRLRWLLPKLRGEAVLFGLRHRLRQHNLYDTPAADPPQSIKFTARTKARTTDGTDTDVGDRDMGAAGTHFGRNGPAFPPADDAPPAADISEQLLRRRTFLPAKTLNLLAAAWLQFEVHDWMQHRSRKGARGDGPLDRDLPPFEQTDPLRVAAPRFVSDQTHWWDASQLYGSDPQFTESIRADGGRVKTGDALLEAIENGVGKPSAPVPNLWLGLALFHELFAREHNAICDALASSDLELGDEALFNKARLVNAALMAKIHTVEWTPAVIAHKLTEKAILATWWGMLGERTRKHLGRFGRDEVFSGIPGSRTHHDGVRYSLTEEFVAVYRMHPLIPDTVTFRSVRGRCMLAEHRFEDLTVGARPFSERLRDLDGFANALYSLAVEVPGQITLHNYPEALRKLRVPGGGELDLAKRDIERTREAALPRYNDFRRAFRLAPAACFRDVTGGDHALADDLAGIYRGVEDVDLMVGLFAERPPDGFAFSDTAFRVFLLMAARRLRSDRFFTTDFTPGVYTPVGYRWVQNRTMKRMLVEHFPVLRPAIPDGNVFKPWHERP